MAEMAKNTARQRTYLMKGRRRLMLLLLSCCSAALLLSHSGGVLAWAPVSRSRSIQRTASSTVFGKSTVETVPRMMKDDKQNSDEILNNSKKNENNNREGDSSSSSEEVAEQQQQQQQIYNDFEDSNIDTPLRAETSTTNQTDTSTKTLESRIEKKIRVAKAQAEIDRILSSPDAPFDVEAELEKVIRISPPPSSANNENNEEDELLLQQQEAVCAKLEHELYESVKKQEYGTAARQKLQLQQLHFDDSLSVLQANAAYYRAFSNKDATAMQQLWLQDDAATCIHPSHKPIVGAKHVCQSWNRMFAQQQQQHQAAQRHWVEPTNIRIAIKGAGTAVVTCDEHVYARRFVRGQKRVTERINELTATNLFRKVSGRWYLTYHHASWHADSHVAQQALRVASSSNKNQQQQQRSTNKNDNGDNEIGMDGILGINNFGPILGNDSDDKSQQPKKRIVMGSLSDILGGNLDDLFSGNAGSNSNKKTNDNNNENGKAFIRIHHVEEEDDDEDEDDEDMEIVDVDDDDDDDSVAMIKKNWEDRLSSPSPNNNHKKKAAPSSRQRCIALLRKLGLQGSISPKQKRVLLTDIISCSAKNESSMVEVAFDLLCSEDDDNNNEVAEEEFADQCRVLAESLPDSHVTRSLSS